MAKVEAAQRVVIQTAAVQRDLAKIVRGLRDTTRVAHAWIGALNG